MDCPQSQSLTCDWQWNLARVSWAVSAVVVELLKPVDPPPTKPQSWLVSRANQLKISVSFAPSGPALAAALFSVKHIILLFALLGPKPAAFPLKDLEKQGTPTYIGPSSTFSTFVYIPAVFDGVREAACGAEP